MRSSVVIGLKIGGSFALGILTGVHVNFSLDTIKSILTLASAPQAQRAFVTSLGLLRATVRPLEIFATTALMAAWVISPRGARHPYLWIATAPVLLSVGIEKLKLAGVENGVLSTETVGRRGTGAQVEINGEVVKAGVEDWRRWGLVRGAIVGTGFVLSLVGLYGDRYH